MKRVAKRATKLALEPDAIHWVATEGSILVPATRAVVITIGIRLQSQGRWSNNWRAAAGRSQQLRKRVMSALYLVAVQDVTHHLGGVFPKRIAFTRLAPRKLDTDNCVAVFKPARDQVCCWLAGRNDYRARADDGVRSGYEFSYYQQAQKLYGLQVELRAA